MVDEVAVSQSQILLNKAETIFQKLDNENSLVLSCLDYIRRLSRMCSIKKGWSLSLIRHDCESRTAY